MLIIDIKKEHMYDELKNRFVTVGPKKVRLEHSLLSISKWESVYKKPFIPHGMESNKTEDEVISYIRYMLLDDVTESVFILLYTKHIETIFEYIKDSRTATIIRKTPDSTNKSRSQFITSELVYSWMIAYNIPFETETWHFNRLLTLIDVCNAQNTSSKNKSGAAELERRRKLNQERLRKIRNR